MPKKPKNPSPPPSGDGEPFDDDHRLDNIDDWLADADIEEILAAISKLTGVPAEELEDTDIFFDPESLSGSSDNIRLYAVVDEGRNAGVYALMNSLGNRLALFRKVSQELDNDG